MIPATGSVRLSEPVRGEAGSTRPGLAPPSQQNCSGAGVGGSRSSRPRRLADFVAATGPHPRILPAANRRTTPLVAVHETTGLSASFWRLRLGAGLPSSPQSGRSVRPRLLGAAQWRIVRPENPTQLRAGASLLAVHSSPRVSSGSSRPRVDTRREPRALRSHSGEAAERPVIAPALDRESQV